MTSELRKIIEKRCSVRSFSSRDIERKKIDEMVEAFRLAPSAVNKQPWRLYVVSSGKAKSDMQKSYDREWFAEAPLYFVVCGVHSQAWHRSDGKDHTDIDVAIATEHLVLSATSIGLGSCWVCNFDVDMCKKAIGVTDVDEEPIVIIPIGYPKDENVWAKEKNRKNVADFVKVV